MRLRRVAVTVLWLLGAAMLLPQAVRIEERLVAAGRIEGSESAAVETALATRFASPFARSAALVVTGIPPVGSPRRRAVLRDLVAALDTIPFVTRVASPLDGGDPLLAAADGRGAILIAGVAGWGRPVDSLVVRLRAATASAGARVRREFPSAALRWTGEMPIFYDLRRFSAADVRRSEARAVPLTLALLLAAFGAAAAALLPILSGMLAIALALGAAAMLAAHWRLSILLQNVTSILGLALGIDYALLMVSRFRESLAGVPDAAAAGGRSAGFTVALSGAAVAIGLAALLVVPETEIRSVAVGGLLVVATSVLLATTLLPRLLRWLGPRVEMGRIRKRRPAGSAGERWRRWGGWVAAHPWSVLIGASAPLLLLAWSAPRLSPAVPSEDWLPPAMESARAVRDLQAMRRTGIVNELRVLVELPRGSTALEPGGWSAVARVGLRLAADGRVARVRALPLMVHGTLPLPVLLALVPDSLKRLFVSEDGRAALIELVPREEVGAHDMTRLARELRAAGAAELTALAGARVLVGGLPAFNADYQDAVARPFWAVVALIVGGTLLALLVGFRSVLVPVKAVVLNLLSVGAALGALVLVFQDGHGSRWFGVAQPLDGVFPPVPLLVFCTVFGISMDYEVFLVSRVREARRGGCDESAAIAEGLARTGGLITSAAAIMVAVFGAFAMGDYLPTKLLGFALAVAVLVDATLVRVALGPALLRLAGRWNWWPGG